MRIGMFGNQNNYPFLLARALKGLGHDVRMLIDRPEPLNRPEHRYRDVPYPYPDWIEEVRRVEIDDVVCRTTSWQAVLDRLAACDGVVLNTLGIAAAAQLDVPAFCLATGSDLDIYARPAMAERYARNQETRPRGADWLSYAWRMRRMTRASLLELAGRVPAPLYRAIRKAMFRRFAQAQGAGLGRAAAVSYFPPGTVPAGDAVIEQWIRPPSSRMFVYMTDLEALRPEPAPLNPVLRLFNATRFDWAAPFPPMVGAWENKRNDILVRGIAIYYRRTGRPIDVRFVTKGQSVPDTRALVHTLGIDGLVTWRDEMTQREVFEEYTRADVISEQFGRHAVGMAGFDALAMGRPVLCNWRPEIFEGAFGEAAPFLQARTPDEVADQLVRLEDVNLRVDLGARGRQFVERHASPDRAARVVIAVLQRALAGRGRAPEAA